MHLGAIHVYFLQEPQILLNELALLVQIPHVMQFASQFFVSQLFSHSYVVSELAKDSEFRMPRSHFAEHCQFPLSFVALSLIQTNHCQ